MIIQAEVELGRREGMGSELNNKTLDADVDRCYVFRASFAPGHGCRLFQVPFRWSATRVNFIVRQHCSCFQFVTIAMRTRH